MSLIVAGSRTLDGHGVFMASTFLGKHARNYLWSANLCLTPRMLKNSPWVLLNLIGKFIASHLINLKPSLLEINQQNGVMGAVQRRTETWFLFWVRFVYCLLYIRFSKFLKNNFQDLLVSINTNLFENSFCIKIQDSKIPSAFIADVLWNITIFLLSLLCLFQLWTHLM